MSEVNLIARRVNKQPQFQVVKPLPVNAELKVTDSSSYQRDTAMTTTSTTTVLVVHSSSSSSSSSSSGSSSSSSNINTNKAIIY